LALGGSFKMSKLTKFFLAFLIILLVFPLLVMGGLYFFGKSLQKMSGIAPEGEPTESLTQDFIIANGKLKLEYPSDWMKIEPEKLGQIIPPAYIEKYNIQLPLIALKVTGGEKFAQLIIMELSIEEKKNFQEIVNILKEINGERGWEIEINPETVEEKMVVFTSKYKHRKNEYSEIYGKEKVLFSQPKETQKKVYIISVLGWTEDWGKIREEARTIISSARLLD